MFKRKSDIITVVVIVVLLVVSFFLGSGAEKGELEISLAPEVLFSVGGFPVTNAFIWTIVASLLLIGVAIRTRLSLKTVPGKMQNFLEILVGGGFSVVQSLMNDDAKKAKRAFPLVFTMFLFILTANLFPFIPGLAAITVDEYPLFRAATSDYGMVLVMTLISVLLAQIVSFIAKGPFGYLKGFINFSGPLPFVMGIMELIGEVSKILSLSFRLFGNIFAGEVLVTVMLFLLPYFVPLPFMFLGLIAAVIQAAVFPVLTTIFISMASEVHHGA